jgi:GT2 family glycosyltransferase
MARRHDRHASIEGRAAARPMESMTIPLLSIVTPVFNTDPTVLEACLASVASQDLDDWEHCLVDDASTDPTVRSILESRAAADPRVRVSYRLGNGGIVAASNDALRMARGRFVAFLDHDDLLTPNVLQAVADAIEADADLDYIYTDEDYLTISGTRFHPTFKPDWSPERFRSHMYTCHLSVVRRSLALDVGGFRSGYDGSQDYDLILRVSERARSVRHLPILGYHWRMGPESTAANPDAKPYAHAAGLRAVQDHCDRIGLDARVEMLPVPGYHRLVRTVRGHPSVAAIVSTGGERGRTWGAPRTYVASAVESVVKRAGHAITEVVIASPSPLNADVVASLDASCGTALRLVVVDRGTTTELMNHAVARATSDYLLLLHDDVEAISDGFLATLLGLAQAADVGLVGCRHLAPDGTLDHAGHVYMGKPGTAYHGRGADEIGRNGLLVIDREVSGVSTACALMRTDVFDRIGGFSPIFCGAYRDVDLSLKVRRLGLRILYTPHATLFHFGATDPAPGQDDRRKLEERWHGELNEDPYHHPKLLRGRDDWAIPFGPDA